MPQSKFRWLSRKEISGINWSTVDADNDLGYFVECTLHYPIEIREHTKDFPLCAENKIITYDMLSEYQKKFLKRAYGNPATAKRNLLPLSWTGTKCMLNSIKFCNISSDVKYVFLLKLLLNQI